MLPIPASPCVPMLFGLLGGPRVSVSVCACVSVVVTIRQRAESLSIRVGADHFLVGHHPGRGIIHLGMKEQTVKDRHKNSTQETEVQHTQRTRSQG